MTNNASTQEHDPTAGQANGGQEPIAIIGIGCRFPGGANSAEKFWQLMVDEIDAVSDIPADRVDVAPYYDPVLAAPGKIASSQGGFLEHVDQFDASFFGVSPREANYMDPQQRLLLETAWEAFEDAGLPPENLKESRTGVYIGLWASDYTEKMYKAIDDINLYVTTGGGRYAASGRLSYFFGLQGPSLTVDTACSSSLVTVHLACQSLRDGESDMALAGGVNLILEPSVSIGYSRSKMLSQDGRCKFGDARANGYVRSEGVGIVILKRFADAQRDNDRIYAVIRGSAVNNDGRSSELLVAPGVGSQVDMLRAAYRSAGVDPARVGYLEAHGTGTPIGDPVELEALGKVLSVNRPASAPCRLGSVKTNIGHTESASGVAGVIKAALCLQHKAIPASLHFKDPNPKIPWGEIGLRMQTKLEPWPAELEPAIASVNSFGITGTNANLVLGEAPKTVREKPLHDPSRPYLLPLSAQTPDALRDSVRAYLDLLASDAAPDLHDLCYTAACRRTHHAERLAVTGASLGELAESLSGYLDLAAPGEGAAPEHKLDADAKVVFVFPGQGAQWLGMGRELLAHNPVFRAAMEECETALQKWTDWSLLHQLGLADSDPAYCLDEISVIQPVLFAIEVALAKVWQAWGVEPDAVLGHSMGEVAAAAVSGALTLEDAARVICSRSRLMQRTSGSGAMAVIGLPFAEAQAALEGYENRLSIAVQNSPRSTVISGDPDALNTLMESLRAQEIFCRLIKVDVASHSPQMDPLRPELVTSLDGITPRGTWFPFYSTVTQNVIEGSQLDAEYWGVNLRQPVRFSDTVQRLLDDGHTVFIEMSPHPILLTSIEETSRASGQPARGIASLRREKPERAALLAALGELYVLGYRVDWQRQYPDGGAVVTLPAYPWQREKCWFESAPSQKQSRPGAHPLLGQYMQSAAGAHIWQTAVSTKAFPYLNDHQVRGSAVFPAAAYVEMALAGAAEVYGSRPCALAKIAFQEAFYVPTENEAVLQLLVEAAAGAAQFTFYSRAPQNDGSDAWTLHASGTIVVDVDAAAAAPVTLDDARRQPSAETPGDAFYQAVAARGLHYGANFQTFESVSQSGRGILTRIRMPEAVVSGSAKYLLHPVLVDACFQSLLPALPDTNEDTYLPASLARIQTHAVPNLTKGLWCYVVPRITDDAAGGDLFLFNDDGQIVLSAYGMQMPRLLSQPSGIQDLLYQVEWSELPAVDIAASEPRHWLIFADQTGAGQSLAAEMISASQTCTLVYASSAYQPEGGAYRLDPCEPEHYQRLLRDVPQPIHGIVHLWSLDQQPDAPAVDASLLSILYLTQAAAQAETPQAPRLTLVTRGTQPVQAGDRPLSVQQSALWGLGAVIANEFPNLHCTRIDLSLDALDSPLLAQTLLTAADEDQIALRGSKCFAARLKNYRPVSENGAQPTVLHKNADALPLRVKVTTPGIIDGLALEPVLRKAPKAGQVEIAVKAVGLNFMNVMAALGILPGYADGVGPLGIECAGTILRVGEGVTEFQPGDEVAAIAIDCLKSHALADARLVVKKPDGLTFAEAASLPIAYLTAYYALHDLGRMVAGDRVLIHSATGGVGLAAVQLAQRAGVEIFATAGSEEKRALLRQMGITHVMDSRSLSFADAVMRDTRGEGVDIVLNSLAGEAIAKGLEILKPYGRFLEIGKSDIYKNSKVGLFPFQNNLSYFAIDLDKMSRERPDIIGAMLQELFDLFQKGELTPLPLNVFPVSRVRDGFRLMAQSKHVGKIVITLDDPEAAFERPAGAPPVRADATYLITGGLRDLGLSFAQQLAQQGARNLVLVGRSAPSETAQQVIDELRGADVNVRTARADVTDRAQMAALFEEIQQTLPPLRGIIHAAGLLADATMLQMDRERFERALAPKALGAWNLHALSAEQPLDFFVLFSSIAAIVGMPGQANYAAGNAYLDGLARFRRAQGLPALSINWGPWGEIGLANKQANRGARLSQQGLKSITTAQGLEAMSFAMTLDTPQITVMELDAQKWCASQPAAERSSLFRDLQEPSGAQTGEKPSGKKDVRADLLAAEAGRPRAQVFDAFVREQVAQVLRMPPARIPSDKPLKTLGLDSLMSIELRNRLETALGVSLPASLIWNYPTVAAMTPFLAEKIGISLEAQSQPAAPVEAEPETQALDDLDKDELEALLADELSAIDETLKGSGLDTDI